MCFVLKIGQKKCWNHDKPAFSNNYSDGFGINQIIIISIVTQEEFQMYKKFHQ